MPSVRNILNEQLHATIDQSMVIKEPSVRSGNVHLGQPPRFFTTVLFALIVALPLRQPTLEGGWPIHLSTVSLEGDEEPAQMVARADEALYRAKTTGRNKWS